LPHRITGTEKCTHKNKKTGLQDCNKLGRFSQKPMISWNKFDKTGKKRAYYQFIHNDGTRHNIESVEQHRLNRMKGHPFEDLFKGINTLTNFFSKIAEASLKWNLTETEERFLIDALRQGDFEPIIKKFKQSEYKRRKKIYDDTQRRNEEKYRNYNSVEFENIDRIARKSLLGLSREGLKLELYELTEEQFIKVYERFNELVNAYEKWLYDRRELFRQVAREKFNGRIPPELERKLSARNK
jgi:hypothetical protein